MKRIALIALGWLIFLTAACAESNDSIARVGPGESCNSDQPSDYYFVPEVRYAKQPFLIKTQRPGQVVEDRYTDNLVRFALRPLNTYVAFPRNYLQSVQRPCARIAHQYWDLVFIEALLPDFSPRTKNNEALFSEGATLDHIKVRIGFLSQETAHVKLQKEINDGKLVEIANFQLRGLKEYRDPSRKERVFPSFYIADVGRIHTPNKNPIVIGCYSDWMGQVEDAVLCEVTFTLPHTLWSKEQQSLFGGVEGLAVSYWFYKKHLASWERIHSKILHMVDEAFTDIHIPSSNSETMRNAVQPSSTKTVVDEKHHVALTMVKKLHLGNNLEPMSYQVAVNSQTYLMIAEKVGGSTAQSLVKDELKRLQPKYQQQWDECLSRSYEEYFDTDELQSITNEKQSSKYLSKYTLMQNAVGKSMRSRSTRVLTDFVSEGMRNVFAKVVGTK